MALVESVQLLAGEARFPEYLPIVVLRPSERVRSRERVPGRVVTIDYSRVSGVFGPVGYDGRAEVSVRGNTSYYFDKKSYRLELQTPDGEDNKVSLLGLPAESDWVLYGSVTDFSFIRTVLAHELWRGMGHYAVRWRLVELFMVLPATNNATGPPEARFEISDQAKLVRVLNTLLATDSRTNRLSQPVHPLESLLPDSYLGVYVLLEKIKRGKQRVNIKKLRPSDDQEPDISGGYILSKDKRDSGERGLMTGQEFVMEYVEPKEREITAAQKKWMAQYLDDFERALYGQNFRDPASGYPKYIDVESFVDFHWLVEMSRNGDGYWFSQYLHKDRGSKLKMGPVWDWDAAFGNTFFVRGAKTEGWRFERAEDPDYTWYRRLFEDPDFLQRYIDRWSELRTNVFATSNVLALVDRIAAQVEQAQARDTHRWRESRLHQRRSMHQSYEEEVKALKAWIAARLAWIDSQGYPRPVAEAMVESDGVNRRSPKEAASEVLSPRPSAIGWAREDTGPVKEARTEAPSRPNLPLTLPSPPVGERGNAGRVTIRLTRPVGFEQSRIFYTVDGSDPRAPGGSAAPRAVEYTTPITLPTTATLTARARSPYGLWSAPVVIKGAGANPPLERAGGGTNGRTP